MASGPCSRSGVSPHKVSCSCSLPTPLYMGCLSCSSIYKGRNTETDEDIAGMWPCALGFDPGVGQKLNFCPRENSFFRKSFVETRGRGDS